MAPGPQTPSRALRLPLYVGGLMGPFGTGIMTPMIPELRETFGVSTTVLGWSWALYLVPFAVLMLVSGTLSERWGRRRTARATFALYGAVTFGCAIAPNLGWFLVGRALAGGLNAFFTPILLAALADSTPAQRLGAAVGVYAGFQSFGSGLAPLTGGIAADINWRWAFVLVAAGSLDLATFPPPGEPEPESDAPNLRSLLRRPLMLLGAAAFFASFGPIGISIVVGLEARDGLGLSGSAGGLVQVVGPLAAMWAGRPWGSVVDSWGGRRAATAAFAICSLLVAGMAGAGTALTLSIAWAVAGFSTNFVVVSIQALAAQSAVDNRAGAISFVLAHRFMGHALGALVWLPVYAASPDAAFYGSAAVGLAGIAAIVLSGLGTENGHRAHR